MAKTKTHTRTKIVPYKPGNQTIRIITPKTVSSPKITKGKNPFKARHARKAANENKFEQTLVGVAVGGAALGMIEQMPMASMIPDVPIIGRKGAIAIGAAMLYKQGIGGEIMRDIAIASAAAAGYQLGSQGKITGEGYGLGTPLA